MLAIGYKVGSESTIINGCHCAMHMCTDYQVCKQENSIASSSETQLTITNSEHQSIPTPRGLATLWGKLPTLTLYGYELHWLGSSS